MEDVLHHSVMKDVFHRRVTQKFPTRINSWLTSKSSYQQLVDDKEFVTELIVDKVVLVKKEPCITPTLVYKSFI